MKGTRLSWKNEKGQARKEKSPRNQPWIFIQREFVYGENIFLTPE